jgi:hypothetical protein
MRYRSSLSFVFIDQYLTELWPLDLVNIIVLSCPVGMFTKLSLD